MRAFPLGFGDSLITKWNECVWNERVFQAKASWGRRNWRDVPKETCQEHSIGHSRCALHGNVGHPFGHVVGQVEGLPNGLRVEHVAKVNIDMILVSYGANDIGAKE